MNIRVKPTRRDMLKDGGALIVGFSLIPEMDEALAQRGPPGKPLALSARDSYPGIDAQGTVTLYSGTVDLGTGVESALAQMAGEELDVPFSRVHVVQGDAALPADQGNTWASVSIQSGGI